MKKSLKLSASLLAGAASLMAATPAFAQDYSYDYSGDAAAGGIVCGVYACLGVFFLLTFGFWVWMLIDLIGRQEYEFPNSTGSSKTTWIIIMLVSWVVSAGWIAAVVYYFMVFKKIKRGSMTPPSGGGYVPPQGGYQPPAGGYTPPPGQGTPPPPPPAPPAPPAQ